MLLILGNVRQSRNKTNKTIKMLRKLSHVVPSDTIKKLYYGVVLPALGYCDVVWRGCSKTELEVVHSNAAHAVLGAPYRASATLLRHTLGWSAPRTLSNLDAFKRTCKVISLIPHLKQSASFAIAVTCCLHVYYSYFLYFLYCVLHVYMILCVYQCCGNY